MAGNSFNQVFRITTFGESHGKAIGVTIDGCPAGICIDTTLIQKEMLRRRPGQSNIVTQRNETDEVEILSGIFEGKTTGTPIHLLIWNKDQRSKDYSHIKDKYRPSHADYTYDVKWGHRDYRGGGRSSARETAARVAAGAIAKQILQKQGISIKAYVSRVGELSLETPYQNLDLSLTESNPVRCPDVKMAKKMEEYISKIKKKGDTIGGIISCVIQNCPAGLGEPVFDKLHADLAKAMLSINACKGFEYGSGFSGTKMLGSTHNDVFYKDKETIKTQSNFSGGIQGGISNGEDIYFNCAFKPVATLIQTQKTINNKGEITEIQGKGRHDPCVVPRAVPIVEAMAALTLVEHWLRQRLAKK